MKKPIRNKRASAHDFRRTAQKTLKANLPGQYMRGGIRL